MALGARPEDVVWAVVRRCLLLILLGEVFGVALSATLSKTLATSSMLFEVDHRDASTYVAVALAWLAVGFIACYLPAREATRVDPMAALRNG